MIFIKNIILSAFTSDTHVFKNHQFEFSRGTQEVKKTQINKIIGLHHTLNRGSQALLKITQNMNSELIKKDVQ